MKRGTKEVKSDQKILGECDYDIYDSVLEATNALGETQLLDILNAQIRTNAMNAFRTSKTKGPTKSALRTKATNDVVQELLAGGHPDAIGNESAIQNLIDRRMAEIEIELKSVTESEFSEFEEA
jgi:hypothetical protein